MLLSKATYKTYRVCLSAKLWQRHIGGQITDFLSYHTWEETQRFQVLQDVAVFSGDEHHVELLQGLVDVAHALRLHKRVLLARVHQLGEGGEQPLHPGPRHLHKLTRHDGLASLGANRRCQQHLRGTRESIKMKNPNTSITEDGGSHLSAVKTVAMTKLPTSMMVTNNPLDTMQFPHGRLNVWVSQRQRIMQWPFAETSTQHKQM